MNCEMLKIVRDVRVALNFDAEPAPAIEATCSGLSLDQIIRAKAVEAVREAHLEALPCQLECARPFVPDALGIAWTDGCAGWLSLPADFLRLVTFEMNDWERPAGEPIDPASAAYALQRGRFAGLRGTPQRPVVAIVRHASGLVLEFYSCRSKSAAIRRAVYGPEPKVDDETDTLAVSAPLYGEVIARTAAKVKATLNA
ncbi:MAG: hypothetical protein K2N16_03535 [Muribaculaceae bacterium]|nr:hypothetical protein [Muribaculaceae bacterium]